MNVAVIGLGLIGGSIALDIKKVYPEAVVFGIDNREEHVKEALALHIIDKEASLELLPQVDWVILAVPVDVAVILLPVLLDRVTSDTIIFDVGSTKQSICKVVENHPKRQNFVASHPIAGTEFSGPSAAITGLFVHKTNIICEAEKTAEIVLNRAMQLFERLGMQLRFMDASSHDKHIAYVSHLSHISSFMLGKTVIEKEKNERDIFDMAGSGFASTVRLAKSSPVTWTSIFKENKDNVVEALDEYIENLRGFKQILIQEQYELAYVEMENTNRLKQILKGIQ